MHIIPPINIGIKPECIASRKDIPRHRRYGSYYSHIVAIELWNSGGRKKIAEWCRDNLDGDWMIGTRSSSFVLGSDAMAFKLRWE